MKLEETKRLFTSKEALISASHLKCVLAHFSERIAIAGSLRRERPAVHDIEFVIIPKLVPRQQSFFADPEMRDLASEAIDNMVHSGILEKRLSVNGREAWGDKNKLAREVSSGIPVDFFFTTHENWVTTLFIRTGGKATNIEVATRAKQKGWRLNAYGNGFSCGRKVWPVTSEEEIFKFVGLPYFEPSKRP